MEPSLFIEYVRKYFPGIVTGVVETLNGSENLSTLTYLHRQDLSPIESISGKWESITVNGNMVAADYVALDSPLPLKSRDSIGKASGDIHKMGMKKQLNEQQLQDLDTMVALGRASDDIAIPLFRDTKAVIGGIYEKLEYAYLLGLSSGVALIEDSVNVGTGIRIDYAYPSSRKFGVPVVWSNTSSTPIADINNRIIAAATAEGKRVTKIRIDKATLTNILKTTEAKDLYAMNIGNYGDFRPTINLDKLNTSVDAEYGYTFEVIDRSVMIERDGTRSSVKPWVAGAVVALTTEKTGTLTYARLAEENHPVPGVQYQKAAEYILVSKYRKNDPLQEFTASMARVVPVVSETVYLMDSTTVVA